MKSPIVFNWGPFKFSIAIGALVAVLVAITLAICIGPITLVQGVLLFVLFLAFVFIGFSLTPGSFYHRKVKHPVDLKNLKIGEIYWLNGETHATYQGFNSYTGQYLFTFYGVKEIQALIPGLVMAYISSEKE